MSIDIDIKSVGYGAHRVLSDIRANMPDAAFTAIVGRNGSGKSTLVGALLSLVSYDGDIRYGDRQLSKMSACERARTVSGILQRQSAPHITVEELAALGRSPYKRGGFDSSHDGEIVDEAIARTSLGSLRSSYLDEISGGELKRAYFAMLLAQNTQNVILDEATASMDADFENEFLKLASSLAHEGGRCVAAVMHNLDHAVKYADYILLLDGGRAKFFGTRDELLKTDVVEKTFNVKRCEFGGRVFFCSE